MKKIFALFFIITLKIFANGGPIDGSTFHKTGDIILMEHASVKLINEDLKIKLEGDYSYVMVNYVLKNIGYSKEDITYGFPVEFITDSDWGFDEDLLSNFNFSINAKQLPFKSQIDLSVFESETRNFDNEKVSVKRKWHVMNFSIEKDEIITVKVSYKVKNSFTDWSTSKSFFENYDDRKFIYDFSPAHKWGNGTVQTMNIQVDATEVINKGGKLEFKGIELQENEGVYSLSKSNFDLKKELPLFVSYRNESEKYSKFLLKNRIDKKYLKKIKVSSQLKGNYKKSHLFDGNFKTVWVEGKKGAGIGEKIEVELDNYNLAAICLVNGYTKNASTYLENNRLKKIKVEMEFVDYNDPKKTQTSSFEKTFEDKKYSSINTNNFYDLVTKVGDFGEGYLKIKKVTITILEVYKGTKYNDTCITELFLLGYR
ncbi:NADase-type glycan-binding domain-containing protein [Tenacibaculum sp. ZS6-P6]|uniref:NADase-type glycan-binding domain-containing protein n=1 Tax=Tenacibaculum sp. ZS6-P6 TaxID=3447503 RepID=UPI003F9BFF06